MYIDLILLGPVLQGSESDTDVRQVGEEKPTKLSYSRGRGNGDNWKEADPGAAVRAR